jgi:isopenicillin N synthase-like dioxygenase
VFFITSLDAIVEQLRYACTEAGFYYLLGHGVSKGRREGMFARVRSFHNLTAREKEALQMDRSDWPLAGVGYLPLHHRKLPSRKTGNANEGFIVKRQSGKIEIDIDTDIQWPAEHTMPGLNKKF